MTGTFGGALEARGIPAGNDRLIGETEGTISKDGNILFVESIHIRYRLTVDAGTDPEAIQRAHDAHPPNCPVYRTLEGCVRITTELTVSER